MSLEFADSTVAKFQNYYFDHLLQALKIFHEVRLSGY